MEQKGVNIGMEDQRRRQLTPHQQIEHLKSKGVRFDLISEEEAEKYLIQNNNYFKLRAYRKNFEKYQDGDLEGQYINLDFEMLKDLAIIDMRLRYSLLLLALDVEHFEKVKLLKIISESGDDGYQIVDSYFKDLQSQNNGQPYNNILNEIDRNQNSHYCKSLIAKYKVDPPSYPVWVFVEIISFGAFIHFLDFSADYLQNKSLKEDFYLLRAVKTLRNAAAHNNCLINDLSLNSSKHKPNYDLLRALTQNGISRDMCKKRLSNATIQDIVTLLYTHYRIVPSDGVHQSQTLSLHQVTKRLFKHIEYYDQTPEIPATFRFLKKVVDIFFPM